MKFDKNIFSFKLFYLLYFAAIGAFIPYINVYLESSRGLTGTQIGLITSSSLLVSVCLMPIWGIIGDKTQKYILLVRVAVIGSLVVLYFYRSAMVYPAIITCAIALEAIRLGAIPMSDTIATTYCHDHNGNYGSIRGIGSLGYMLAGTGVGFIADAFGLDGPLFAIYTVLLIFSFGATLGFPKSSHVEKEKKEKNSGAFKTLFTNKKFLFILLITLLTSAISDSALTFQGNHLTTTLGAGASAISWVTCITVLPEVAFLAVAVKLMHKIGFKNYYLFAIATMIFRFTVFSFTTNLYLYLAVSIVHCFGVGIVTVGNLTYIREATDPAVLGTAITSLNASLAVGKAIGGYMFGVVYTYLPSFTIFMIGIVFFIIAFILVLRTDNFDSLHA